MIPAVPLPQEALPEQGQAVLSPPLSEGHSVVRRACPLVPVETAPCVSPGSWPGQSIGQPASTRLPRGRGPGPSLVPAGAAWLFMNKQGRWGLAWEPCTGLWVGWVVLTGDVSLPEPEPGLSSGEQGVWLCWRGAMAVRSCGLWAWCRENRRKYGKGCQGLPAWRHCCSSAQAQGTVRSSSHCAWLLGPSINDSAHFWASVGWLGRANFGWSWVR